MYYIYIFIRSIYIYVAHICICINSQVSHGWKNISPLKLSRIKREKCESFKLKSKTCNLNDGHLFFRHTNAKPIVSLKHISIPRMFLLFFVTETRRKSSFQQSSFKPISHRWPSTYSISKYNRFRNGWWLCTLL